MTSFLAALEFLTRIRVRETPLTDMRTVAAAQAWFPAVGLLIGLALLALDRLAMRALPPASVDVLLVVALVAVTGALHVDGLADSADGLLGGRDREQRLAIMRDARAGAFAIVAIVSVLALKWAGFGALPANVRVEAIVLAPVLARFAMMVTIAAFPYAREDGAGAGFRKAAWPAPLLIGAAATGILAVALLGAGGLYAIAFAAAAGLLAGAYATRRIGGVTGDVYGATVEVTEALALLFIAALANRGWIDAWAFS